MFVLTDLKYWEKKGQFDLIAEIIKKHDQAKHSGKMKDFLASFKSGLGLQKSKLKGICLVRLFVKLKGLL